MNSPSSTLSRSDTATVDGRNARRACRLYLALDCDAWNIPSRAFELSEFDEVMLGRGLDCAGHAEGRALKVTIPDGRVSAAHARLVRELDRWLLEDLSSKNGVKVNGALHARTLLNHGDLIELGRTLFLFSDRLERLAERPPASSFQRAATVVGPPPSMLGTFLPELGEQLTALARIAPSKVPVIVLGETGTGKELAARALHALSGRSGPFVPVNCGALPPTLLESELFGHRRGAFTGATDDRPGIIRSAHAGTLFLDEVGELPAPVQVALLRVLQEGEVMPVGASQPVRVDVRVVAATHRDLSAMAERQEFRSDLFARLSGFTLALPPLRDRREDLGLLIGRILARIIPDGTPPPRLSREAARALFAYPWPHNVRELEKALELSVVLAGGEKIALEHLPEPVRAAPAPEAPATAPTRDAQSTDEDDRRRGELLALLAEHRGNVSAIARALGVARMQVQRWLKRYQLDAERFRG